MPGTIAASSLHSSRLARITSVQRTAAASCVLARLNTTDAVGPGRPEAAASSAPSRPWRTLSTRIARSRSVSASADSHTRLYASAAASASGGGVVDAHVEHLVAHGRHARPLARTPDCLTACDRAQPRLEQVRIAEAADAGGRNDEGVLGGVGRFVAVAQDRSAQVVDRVGVAVVDGGEGVGLASRRGKGQRAVSEHPTTVPTGRGKDRHPPAGMPVPACSSDPLKALAAPAQAQRHEGDQRCDEEAEEHHDQHRHAVAGVGLLGGVVVRGLLGVGNAGLVAPLPSASRWSRRCLCCHCLCRRCPCRRCPGAPGPCPPDPWALVVLRRRGDVARALRLHGGGRRVGDVAGALRLRSRGRGRHVAGALRRVRSRGGVGDTSPGP